MAEAVYILCAVTSALCAFLLLRSYRRGRTRLLLWTSVAFIGLTLNNIILCIDLVFTGPELDLSLARNLSGLFALGALLFGLVWHSGAPRS